MRRRVTQLTKNGLNAERQSLHDCKLPQKISESWQINYVFRLSLGLSTQILEVDYKQAYEMIETGVLVRKSKKIKPYQPVFFYFGSNMHKAKWWNHVSYGMSELECQRMARVYAGRWVKNEATGSTRFHLTLWKKNLSGSHLLVHWRTHTLGFCRKPNLISIRWLGHPNPNSLLLHYRCITSLNTLVGSVRYLITLLKYGLFHYIIELYRTFLHCWATPNPNTLLRYTLSYYIAKQFSNTNTLLSYNQS